MALKRLRLPSKVTYPIRITDVHVTAGQFINRNDLLYTLADANGKLGVIRAPIAGRVSEGPVPVDSTFAEPCPVIGISNDVGNRQHESTTRSEDPTQTRKNQQRPQGAAQRTRQNEQLSGLESILGDGIAQPDEGPVDAIVRVNGIYQGTTKILRYADTLDSEQKSAVFAMVDSWAKKIGIFITPLQLDAEKPIEVVTPFLLPLVSFGLASANALGELTSRVPHRLPSPDELEKYFAKNISDDDLDRIADVLTRETQRYTQGEFNHLGPTQKFTLSELTRMISDQFRLVKFHRARREEETRAKQKAQSKRAFKAETDGPAGRTHSKQSSVEKLNEASTNRKHPAAKEQNGGFLVSVLTPFVVGAVITLFLIQGSNIGTLEFLAVSSIGAAIVLFILGTQELPTPGTLRLFVSTLAFLIMPAFLLILISMPKYSLEHSYAYLIFDNGRDAAGSLSGHSQGPITSELDLPSISSFSNGQVPQPTNAQQNDFERFVLE